MTRKRETGNSPEVWPADGEVLAGLVERVTFHNEENGFCVLRVKARGHRDLATVVGCTAAISAGEWIAASGEWTNDRTHGVQFRARFLRTSAPTSVEGIEKYLASGMIRGVGPVYARKLVQAFGDQVFDLIENAPDRRVPWSERRIDGPRSGRPSEYARRRHAQCGEPCPSARESALVPSSTSLPSC